MVAGKAIRVLGLAVATALGGVLNGGIVLGDTYTFTGNTGNWSDPTQWLNGAVPVNDIQTQVIISGTGSNANVTATVDAARPVWEVNSVTFGSGTGQGNQLTISSGTELEFAGSGAVLSGKGTILGNIALASDLTLLGSFDIGTFNNNKSFNIPLLNAGSFQNLNVNGRASFLSSNSDYSGVGTIFVNGFLQLTVPNAQGGANGTKTASVDVTGELAIGDSNAVNGNIVLHGGSILDLNNNSGLTGNGTITRDASPITVTIRGTNSLSGAELGPGFIHAGDKVILNNDLVNLPSLDPAANYVCNFTIETAGFNLNGGSLTLPSGSLSGSASSAINIGTAGESLIPATIGTTVGLPIIATGPVTINFSASPFNPNLELSNAGNQFQAMSVTNTTLVADSPGTLSGANITLNGGMIVLKEPFNNTISTNYQNVVTVTQDATIKFSGIADLLPFELSRVNLLAANLTFTSSFLRVPATLDTLNLGVDGANIMSDGTVVAIGNITQDGATPRSLTLALSQQSTSVPKFRLTGNISNTGPITLASTGSLEVDGVISSSPAALTIGISSVLTGTGTIHRPVIFPQTTFPSGGVTETLSPGIANSNGSSTPGTMTFDTLEMGPDTNTILNLGQPGVVGGPNNDLIVVLGDLTLSGHFVIQNSLADGTYTVFTYGGNLTTNHLGSPHGEPKVVTWDFSVPGEVNAIVTSVPEPGTFGAMGLGAVLLVRRSRQRRLKDHA